MLVFLLLQRHLLHIDVQLILGVGDFLLLRIRVGKIFVVSLIVVYFNDALADEEKLFDLRFVADDDFALGGDSTKQIDNHFVDETSFALIFEEMLEVLLKIFEYFGFGNKVCLHLWSKLLIEGELFDHQVEVVEEGLFNVFSNVIIE